MIFASSPTHAEALCERLLLKFVDRAHRVDTDVAA